MSFISPTHAESCKDISQHITNRKTLLEQDLRTKVKFSLERFGT